MDRRITCVIVCDKHYSMPPGLFGDLCHAGDGGTTAAITSNVSAALKKSPAACWPHGPDTDNKETEMDARDNEDVLNCNSGLKPYESCDAAGGSQGHSGGGKKRKSVSFLDDVTIYLFDQECPTLQLYRQLEPSSHAYNLQELPLEDMGLEWDDDFSALERNCHYRCVTHSSASSRCEPPERPERSWTALSRPQQFFLSQTCLFLNPGTESELDP
ncbi:uncharacterized protein LOC143001797 [Genypterus blacodes]|uniref:uncharacterized protein LOC143001797 n=1 Tax=Genypterus blacodes TaxID=154954 RepID=UPI003F765806